MDRPNPRVFFPLLLACLLSGPALAFERQDQLVTSAAKDGVKLTWNDTEERVQGEYRPAHPRAGDELRVNLDVGSFEGPAFSGPVRISLRSPDAPAETHVVEKDRAGWHTTFHLTSPGPHTLDVGFRTTHDKMVHASIEVDEASIPIVYAWLLLGAAAVGVIALGIRRVVRPRNPDAEGAAPP